jgi:hypothetical protein
MKISLIIVVIKNLACGKKIVVGGVNCHLVCQSGPICSNLG